MADSVKQDVVAAAVERLRELPPPDGTAVERIVAAAARARHAHADPVADDLMPAAPRRFGAGALAAVAMAAAVVGFLVRPAAAPDRDVAPTAAIATRDTVMPAASAAAARELAPVPTQFVLDAPHARSVSLVGDFNAWGERPVRLERAAGSSLWSVTVPVVPGRHVYAFLVDDSVWTPDPRAPRAADEDFGVAGSVIVVGRP